MPLDIPSLTATIKKLLFSHAEALSCFFVCLFLFHSVRTKGKVGSSRMEGAASEANLDLGMLDIWLLLSARLP